MADMDSAKLLEEIEIYIDNCKTAGVLSSGNMIKVNREELIAMLEEVRMRLPKEIAESKRIVKTKDSSLPPNSHQRRAAATAMPITVGTKYPATLSASLEIGAFFPCASSIILMILESVVSPPV